MGANKSEEREGDPVIDGGENRQELRRERPPKNRHEALKRPEHDRDEYRCSRGKLPHLHALREGGGKGVSGKAEAYEQDGEYIHVFQLFRHHARCV